MTDIVERLRNPMGVGKMTKTDREILACFVMARRIHLGLTRSKLARKLRIRTDQVRDVEASRPFGEDAAASLFAFVEWTPGGH